MAESIEDVVRRGLSTNTFEPEELRELLSKQGHDAAAIDGAIARVSTELAAREERPAQKARVAAGRTASRLLLAGIFVLAAGLVSTLATRPGILWMLLWIAAGAGLIAAGYRTMRTG